MFLFFPYRVDVPHEHRPVINWLFVTAVVVVFWFQITYDSITTQYCLDGWGVRGLFGSIWLHGSISHIFWNSVFLWVFGNAVCSKLGNLSYFPVYIGLGIVAGIGHLLFDGDPAVGASGAISGLIGIHLVLFPENSISCVFLWIFLPHRPAFFTFRSFWFILFWFALNIYGAIRGGSTNGKLSSEQRLSRKNHQLSLKWRRKSSSGSSAVAANQSKCPENMPEKPDVVPGVPSG